MVVLFAAKLNEPEPVTRQVNDLVKELSAELFVLHVCPPPLSSTFATVDPMTGLGDLASYALYDPNLQDELEKAEATAFDEFLSERFDVPVRASLKTGYAASAILEDAEEHEVDIIMLGKRHHGRLERFLMGDVAADVLSHADRPVLMVPFPSED